MAHKYGHRVVVALTLCMACASHVTEVCITCGLCEPCCIGEHKETLAHLVACERRARLAGDDKEAQAHRELIERLNAES